jgi:hypothetical protein
MSDFETELNMRGTLGNRAESLHKAIEMLGKVGNNALRDERELELAIVREKLGQIKSPDQPIHTWAWVMKSGYIKRLVELHAI